MTVDGQFKRTKTEINRLSMPTKVAEITLGDLYQSNRYTFTSDDTFERRPNCDNLKLLFLFCRKKFLEEKRVFPILTAQTNRDYRLIKKICGNNNNERFCLN